MREVVKWQHVLIIVGASLPSCRKWSCDQIIKNLGTRQGCSKRKLTFKLGGSKLTFGSSLVQGRKRVCMRLLRAPWGHIPYNVNWVLLLWWYFHVIWAYIDGDMKEASISDVTGFFRTLCLFSVWHSRVHYSATRTSFATIFDVSESPIHRLSYTVPFVWIIIVDAEKSGGKVQGE